MKCPNCSKEIRDGATFCGFCGKPVAQSAKPASAAPAARPPQQPRPQQPPPRPPVQAAPKKTKTGLIIAACIVAFLLVAGGVFAILVNKEVIDIDLDFDLGSILPFIQTEGDLRKIVEDEDGDGGGSRKKNTKDDADEDEDIRRGEDDEEEDPRSSRDEDDPRATGGGRGDKDGSGSARAPTGTGTAIVDTPEEAERPLASYWYSDIAVCVEDPEMLWPDTKAKPFEDAAERLCDMERLYWPEPLSLLVVTTDNAGGDLAAYTDDYVWVFRSDNTELGALLDEIIVITFDAGRQSCYMARYTDTAHPYDIGGLSNRIASYLSRADYESAASYLLRTVTEPEPAGGTAANSAAADSEYLLPTSGSEYLTKDDLRGLTWEECCFARNEIYARHGRIFSTPAIRSYFEGKSWYNGTIAGATFDANVSNYLSALERANVNLIAEYERETWGGSYY